MNTVGFISLGCPKNQVDGECLLALLNENGLEVLFEVEKIHEFLNEMNDGLEIQDYVLVADMFEYEIAPFFEQAPLIKGIEQ